MTDYVAAAREAWGSELPDWVLCLAEEASRTSQNRAAKRIGYTAAVVHGVLRNSYGGSTALVEERVRGALMSATVPCPALGDIGTHICRDWRDRARKFSSHNTLAVRMFRACRSCPRFRKEVEE